MTDRPNATFVPAAKPTAALLRGAALALLGTLVLAISAKVEVPFYPVPMTLQTLAVLTLGALLGARLAAATVVLYLAEGLAGLPVVAASIRGPREQVVPEVTGLLVPPGDPELLGAALGRLVEDGALRRAMGEAGRVRAAELYDEAKVVARVLDLLAA